MPPAANVDVPRPTPPTEQTLPVPRTRPRQYLELSSVDSQESIVTPESPLAGRHRPVVPQVISQARAPEANVRHEEPAHTHRVAQRVCQRSAPVSGINSGHRHTAAERERQRAPVQTRIQPAIAQEYPPRTYEQTSGEEPYRTHRASHDSHPQTVPRCVDSEHPVIALERERAFVQKLARHRAQADNRRMEHRASGRIRQASGPVTPPKPVAERPSPPASPERVPRARNPTLQGRFTADHGKCREDYERTSQEQRGGIFGASSRFNSRAANPQPPLSPSKLLPSTAWIANCAEHHLRAEQDIERGERLWGFRGPPCYLLPQASIMCPSSPGSSEGLTWTIPKQPVYRDEGRRRDEFEGALFALIVRFCCLIFTKYLQNVEPRFGICRRINATPWRPVGLHDAQTM